MWFFSFFGWRVFFSGWVFFCGFGLEFWRVYVLVIWSVRIGNGVEFLGEVDGFCFSFFFCNRLEIIVGFLKRIFFFWFLRFIEFILIFLFSMLF